MIAILIINVTIRWNVRRIAIYGKGGIGKSTVSSNVAAAMAESGLKVMHIGCDPKSDSTTLLLKNTKCPTVLDAMRNNSDPTLGDIVKEGYGGILCIECGGPKPGSGCAGRGIIAAFEKLEELDAIGTFHPDVVIYDVLGDVVCGGFAMPIRNGYARDVFVVTSGEMMSLYAASNICEAVRSFSQDGYARFGGLIQNSRNVESEDELIDKAASEMGTTVVSRIRRDPSVQRCEGRGVTVVEGEPDSEQAAAYRTLAETLTSCSEDTEGGLRLG
ncbi:MAG: AAA family ATPase [Candidatus Methanoplasma sp.]|jgi:nitrogenase iron protein NifH|nr:AAA family ATPase [Candidatus Methanoplasma sp.]